MLKFQAVGVNAVDLEIVLRPARAVDRDALRVAAQGRVVREIRGRARRERENLREVARRQRQLRDRARVNDAAKLWAIRSDERRGAHHDRLSDYSRDRKLRVECRSFGDDYPDRIEEGRVKSAGRDSHAVRAGRKQRHGVVAFRVGRDFPLLGGGEARDGHFGSDDDGAVRVSDGPGDAACGLTLGESGDGAEDE